MRLGIQGLFVIVAVVLVGKTTAASEHKIKMENLPAAVQAAVKAQGGGATLRGLSKEVENGKTLYEAEFVTSGHGKDVTFNAAGEVVEVEEETTIEAIPQAAREAIQHAVGTDTLTSVETVTEGGKTVYEAHIKSAKSTKEVVLDEKGVVVKAEGNDAKH